MKFAEEIVPDRGAPQTSGPLSLKQNVMHLVGFWCGFSYECDRDSSRTETDHPNRGQLSKIHDAQNPKVQLLLVVRGRLQRAH